MAEIALQGYFRFPPLGGLAAGFVGVFASEVASFEDPSPFFATLSASLNFAELKPSCVLSRVIWVSLLVDSVLRAKPLVSGMHSAALPMRSKDCPNSVRAFPRPRED